MSISLKFVLIQFIFFIALSCAHSISMAENRDTNLNIFDNMMWLYDSIKKDINCLAKNIYWEAVGEPLEGKIAVAQVTINRLQSGKHGENLCQVVYERTKKSNVIVCQFSWTCQRKARINISNRKLFHESQKIALQVYLGNYNLPRLNKAMYFHNTQVRPIWAHHKIVVARIGQHIFYKDKG